MGPSAKPWKVLYEYTGSECPHEAFNAGWGAFAMENNMDKWGVCVFELQDHDYNIKLHVYRVMLEITDTSILHHVFMLIFIALWTIIKLYDAILMPFLSYFARFA